MVDGTHGVDDRLGTGEARIKRNIRIVVEYDGTYYHGWQRQSDKPTIQQILEESICTITRETVRVIGSGRTDAGVHAMNQVANFVTHTAINEENLLKGINSFLPKDIVIKELAEVSESFHSQYDVKSKVYLYQIYNGPVRPSLYRNYAWYIHGLLDIQTMQSAASLFLGTHDFSSFCAADCNLINHVRTITDIDITQNSRGMLRIVIEANGFLRHMVRNIVGTLVYVGKGKFSPSDVNHIIEVKDRRQAGITAPAHGLFLKEVKY
ncbi:MAG: tRNA pseudouridine(38-40) synthase TruA [Deltaproteobacteria bacterium]|nr:tRNA pseudouridine(38-40) synthase TruA [Deltaproteobacteria bacterium]